MLGHGGRVHVIRQHGDGGGVGGRGVGQGAGRELDEDCVDRVSGTFNEVLGAPGLVTIGVWPLLPLAMLPGSAVRIERITGPGVGHPQHLIIRGLGGQSTIVPGAGFLTSRGEQATATIAETHGQDATRSPSHTIVQGSCPQSSDTVASLVDMMLLLITETRDIYIPMHLCPEYHTLHDCSKLRTPKNR